MQRLMGKKVPVAESVIGQIKYGVLFLFLSKLVLICVT